jgi:hypothetical protein
MQLRVWKKIYLCPWIRLNIYTRGVSISFGHRRLGWITLGPRGVRGTLDTPIQGVYLTQQQPWKKLHPK